MTHNTVGLNEVVRLSRTIEDCANPSEFESQALPRIASTFGGESAVVFLKKPTAPGTIALGAGYNFNIEALQSYLYGYKALDPVQSKLERDLLSAGSARASTEDSSSSRDFISSRYYQEFLRPTGIHRYLCSAWRSAGQMVVQFGVHRTRATPDFSPGEYMLSLALMPAISRVFERDIYKSWENILRTLCETLCDALNQRAAIVLNAQGEVLYTDQRALGLLNSGDSWEQDSTAGILRRLVRRARPEVERSAPRAVAVEVQLNARTYRGATIRALPYPGQSLYLLTLERSRGELEHLSSDLGLSPRLAEIVDLIVAGCTNSQIAQKLQLSVNTVRNHISSIYERLAVSGRVDLIRRVTRL